jgi:hypothetical protein
MLYCSQSIRPGIPEVSNFSVGLNPLIVVPNAPDEVHFHRVGATTGGIFKWSDLRWMWNFETGLKAIKPCSQSISVFCSCYYINVWAPKAWVFAVLILIEREIDAANGYIDASVIEPRLEATLHILHA